MDYRPLSNRRRVQDPDEAICRQPVGSPPVCPKTLSDTQDWKHKTNKIKKWHRQKRHPLG